MWRRLSPKDFPAGMVIFCSSELCEVMQPARPLLRRMYMCGPGFDTSVVREALALRQTRACGVVVIDGNEATLGIAQALDGAARPAVTQLAHLTSNIASRTRRGGQSAARFGRNRDGEELAFLRKVAERAGELLGDVRGVIVGGRADMKRKLLPELPLSLRRRVACLIDLACSAGPEALQAAAAHYPEVIEGASQQEALGTVSQFLELASCEGVRGAPLVCYGGPQTAAAVRLGAVDRLLLARAALQRGPRSLQDWHALAAAHGTAVLEVDPRSEAEHRFCEGFGVGAYLRYPVDLDLLEEMPSEDEDEDAPPADEQLKQSSAKVAVPDSDSETVSTATSQSGAVLLRWLQEALKRGLGDDAAAEALTMCVDVLLFDGAAAMNAECVDDAVEMLRGEGVPEDVLVEFACHAADLAEESR